MILFLVVATIVESLVESLKPKPPVFLGPRQNLGLQRWIDHRVECLRLGPRQNRLLGQRIDDEKFIKNAIRTGIIHKDFEKWLSLECYDFEKWLRD